MPGHLFTQYFLTDGICNTPEHRTPPAAFAAFRTAALTLLLVLTSMSAACNAPAETSSPDRVFLEALYHSTDGENWTTKTNWLSDAPIGAWHGVTTDSQGHVRHLQLGSNQLRGPIPPVLGSLSNLEWLDVHENQLTGPIPFELSLLSELQTLWLGGNQLTGAIPPELGRHSRLSYWGLDENQLTGQIPSELGNLSNLKSLGLVDNQLSGEIPSWLGRLRNLESLGLAGNQLTGQIPSELGNLSNLKSLGLVDNQLSGEIPSWLGRLRNLESLGLAENQLHGSIPAELGRLSRLSWLTLSDNRLRGAIPRELSNLDRLAAMLIGGSNHFTGCVPEELGAVPVGDVAALGLPYCDLSGRVPIATGPTPTRAPAAALTADRAALVALYHATDGANWTYQTNWLSEAPLGDWHGVVTDPSGRVVELRLPANRLAGELPSELRSLDKLEILALGGDQLRGTIPPELGKLSNLRVLTLNRNQLTGPIPPELGNLTRLGLLELHQNQLSGAIPRELGGLARLHLLTLGKSNDLTGCIPQVLQAARHHDLHELALPFCRARLSLRIAAADSPMRVLPSNP